MTDCEQYKALLRRWVGEFELYDVLSANYYCHLCMKEARHPQDIEHAPGCLVGDTLRALGESDD